MLYCSPQHCLNQATDTGILLGQAEILPDFPDFTCSLRVSLWFCEMLLCVYIGHVVGSQNYAIITNPCATP